MICQLKEQQSHNLQLLGLICRVPSAYHVTCNNHRSTKTNKVYVVFFICFTTRAVHLELVVNISTLKHFVWHCEITRIIYSDNATNFIGTNNVLNQSKLLEYATLNLIMWKFIPPRSQHFGECGNLLLNRARPAWSKQWATRFSTMMSFLQF